MRTLIAACLIALLCGGILAIGADAAKRRAIAQRERAIAERRGELAPLASSRASSRANRPTRHIHKSLQTPRKNRA
jgi:hypothetical protein